MQNMWRVVIAAGLAGLIGMSLVGFGGSSSASAPILGQPIPDEVVAASAARGTDWKPEPVRYGVERVADVGVSMTDGTVLRADVYYPTLDGERAAGEFPVVMTQTPYGRQSTGRLPERVVGSQVGGANEYLVRRGYISVVADVRGTGASGGSIQAFDPILGQDGAELVRWASRLPGSNGRVGLYGSSYLSITALLTAAAVGPNSPLKAIFPVVAPNDVYKDGVAPGGLINAVVAPLILGLTGVLPSSGAIVDALENPRDLLDGEPELMERLRGFPEFDLPFPVKLMTGQDEAFHDAFWQSRSIADRLQRIVDNDVAVYQVGGHFDVFQRGQWLNYTGLQNAFAGRPVDAPMLPDQPVTGRYQLLVTEHGHAAASVAGLDQLQLRWFDTWLKNRDTGMARTSTPLHVYDLGTGTYVQKARYPDPDATPTRFYLERGRTGTAPLSRNDGGLTTATGTEAGGETVPWLPLGNPCNRALDQWAVGAVSLLTDRLPGAVPCLEDDRLNTVGLDRLTFTTDAFDRATTLAGPITMSIYATANRPEAAWIVQVDDVGSDGSSRPLTQGALLGSLRKLDPATTWRSPSGEVLQAGHTYSRGSQDPVPAGEVVRYDVEVFPTYNTFAAGHRLRVTLSTADPHLVPTLPATRSLLGGMYTVLHGPEAPSALQVLLLPVNSQTRDPG